MKEADATAEQFVERLDTYRSESERTRYERILKTEEGDQFIGVRMGQIFALAKEFVGMQLDEIEKLLDSPVHEIRVGAVSIMDFQARSKKVSQERRKELFDLYIRRHDRINSWDLVDRSAVRVVGGYLFDKPRDILYELTRSKHMAERRTAIVSTLYFIVQGDVEDTFKIAEMLFHDKEDLVLKAVAWALRSVDKKELMNFLDRNAANMPRVLLRYAMQNLSKDERSRYL